MAAGLGFKTFTTGEVLTAADTNGYLMQGVNVFANAAARTAAITSPQEGQMSYLKDTNSTEYYSGSAWVAVGAAGGGMTLLSTTTLSGASTTISSIDQTYVDLYVVINQATCGTGGSLQIAPNGSTTPCLAAGTSYDRSTATTLGVNFNYVSQGVSSIKANDGQNGFTLRIDKYSTNYTKKNMLFYGTFLNPSDVWYAVSYGGHVSTGAQITSLVFSNSAGNWTGGTVYVYGVK